MEKLVTGHQLSDYKLAYCGMVYAVPQGSVLGPSFDINDR